MATPIKLTYYCILCITVVHSSKMLKKDYSPGTADRFQKLRYSNSKGYSLDRNIDTRLNRINSDKENRITLKRNHRAMDVNDYRVQPAFIYQKKNPDNRLMDPVYMAKTPQPEEIRKTLILMGLPKQYKAISKDNARLRTSDDIAIESAETDKAEPLTGETPVTYRRIKRGFRSAVADRIAHGFGKRSSHFDTDYFSVSLPQEEGLNNYDTPNIYNSQDGYNESNDYKAGDATRKEIRRLVKLLYKYRDNSLPNRLSG